MFWSFPHNTPSIEEGPQQADQNLVVLSQQPLILTIRNPWCLLDDVDPQFFKKCNSGCYNETSSVELHWKNVASLHPPTAQYIIISWEDATDDANDKSWASTEASSHCILKSMKYMVLRMFNHGTTSGFKMEVTISAGTVSHWPTLVSIFQSHALSRCPFLVNEEGFCCSWSPFQTYIINTKMAKY